MLGEPLFSAFLGLLYVRVVVVSLCVLLWLLSVVLCGVMFSVCYYMRLLFMFFIYFVCVLAVFVYLLIYIYIYIYICFLLFMFLYDSLVCYVCVCFLLCVCDHVLLMFGSVFI